MDTNTAVLDYTLLRRTVYRLRDEFPFAEFSALSRSWNNRALFSLRLGNTDDPVLLLGGFDGLDTLSPQVLLSFFEKMCKSYVENTSLSGIRIRSILQTRGVMILPCVNPDGLESKQNTNAHGVNLAENYKPHWHERKHLVPLSDDAREPLFAGKVPESEPETRAILRACRHRAFRHIMVLREGDDALCVSSPKLPEQRAEMMQKVLCSTSGLPAEPPCFSPGRYCGIAEQFSEEFNRPAFCLSFCGTKESVYRQLEETLVLSCIM
ncbi:MAG TPA: hypothetical protein DDY98_05195 [Ruminococcaceae bacterium]|nr:hypothetical protein [Oscillospiraceae bacterium]